MTRLFLSPSLQLSSLERYNGTGINQCNSRVYLTTLQGRGLSAEEKRTKLLELFCESVRSHGVHPTVFTAYQVTQKDVFVVSASQDFQLAER